MVNYDFAETLLIEWFIFCKNSYTTCTLSLWKGYHEKLCNRKEVSVFEGCDKWFMSMMRTIIQTVWDGKMATRVGS